ncbi:MAG TPA: SRPBCC domain-containing protein [Methylomirabilota bacterium]|nr:SRPBCC domain-containing protein [Methylomirabilota bacterium]
MIDLRRVIDLAVEPAVVWERLWDVPALAACIPGCDAVETVEAERRYRATIRDKVGPFRIAIPLEVAVDPTPPTRLGLSATGRDAALGSPIKLSLVATIATGARGGTRLVLEGRGEVGGKLAALGQGVIERKTRDILDRFATNLTALFAAPRGS